MSDDRHETGLRAVERLGGPEAAAPILAAADIAPDLVRFAIDFAFGEVLSRPELDVRTRELCTVAALTALGPGIGSTRMPASRAAATSAWPGSDTSGVPASDTSAIDSPARSRSISLALLSRSLCSWRLVVRVEME